MSFAQSYLWSGAAVGTPAGAVGRLVSLAPAVAWASDGAEAELASGALEPPGRGVLAAEQAARTMSSNAGTMSACAARGRPAPRRPRGASRRSAISRPSDPALAAGLLRGVATLPVPALDMDRAWFVIHDCCRCQFMDRAGTSPVPTRTTHRVRRAARTSARWRRQRPDLDSVPLIR